jgi:hypothetical protein
MTVTIEGSQGGLSSWSLAITSQSQINWLQRRRSELFKQISIRKAKRHLYQLKPMLLNDARKTSHTSQGAHAISTAENLCASFNLSRAVRNFNLAIAIQHSHLVWATSPTAVASTPQQVLRAAGNAMF